MGQVKTDGTEILRVLCGSRAYGLHDESSDYDYHGVYVVPTSKILSIGYLLKETSWVEGQDQDNTAWEIGHFLKMATQCNPTVLETFVAPIVAADLTGAAIRSLFPYVISRQRVYDAFRGYASNQRKKMFEPYGEDLERRAMKAAVAYLRSLYHGVELLLNGTYDPHIASISFREDLKKLKRGEHKKWWVVAQAERLEDEIKVAYATSKIPVENDIKTVNEFLLEVRKEMW